MKARPRRILVHRQEDGPDDLNIARGIGFGLIFAIPVWMLIVVLYHACR